MATRSPHSFGDLLRTYRTAAGLTQEELAARAGMSARGISDLERGARRTPYKGTIELLAEALHLTQEEHTTFVQAARRRSRSVASSGEATANVRSTLPPLIGRRDELVLLQDLLDGQGASVVLLAGEPGNGQDTAPARGRYACQSGRLDRPGGQLFAARRANALRATP